MITKGGKPVAALIDIALFERLRHLDENFTKLRSQFSEAFAQLDETDLDALFDEAIAETRKQKSAK
jgi:hypothetical protein